MNIEPGSIYKNKNEKYTYVLVRRNYCGEDKYALNLIDNPFDCLDGWHYIEGLRELVDDCPLDYLGNINKMVKTEFYKSINEK